MIPVLFQSSHFVVLNKPAGLPAHPGPGGGASVEDSFPALSRRKDGPWLAHRLDADTAGCLVVALRKQALLAAQAAFTSGSARKTYWAVVHGVPAAASGEVSNRLSKRSTPSGWRMEPRPDGVPAHTGWRLMGQAGGLAWLELRPRTGRTHQIRVHYPVYGRGDGAREDGAREGGPMQLLARAIALPLPPPIVATAPPPPHMRPALLACGWPGDDAGG